MKVVTVESEGYKSLVRKIEWIYSYVKNQAEENVIPKPSSSEVWISNSDASNILRVSKRTMQRLRSKGEVTYSIRGGKVWYTQAEVERLLSGRLVIQTRKEVNHE